MCPPFLVGYAMIADESAQINVTQEAAMQVILGKIKRRLTKSAVDIITMITIITDMVIITSMRGIKDA